MYIPEEDRKKLDEKGEELTFVGYSAESKAFRLLDKSSNKMKISRDVAFLDGFLIHKPLENYIQIRITNDRCLRNTSDTSHHADENNLGG